MTMAHVLSAHPEVERLLFKPDRRRAIDEHIDYFGGTTAALVEQDHDTEGTERLERLA
jgi:hypothetical protein